MQSDVQDHIEWSVLAQVPQFLPLPLLWPPLALHHLLLLLPLLVHGRVLLVLAEEVLLDMHEVADERPVQEHQARPHLQINLKQKNNNFVFKFHEEKKRLDPNLEPALHISSRLDLGP